MKFYELRMGEESRQDEIGVAVVKGCLTLVVFDGNKQTHYTTDGHHVAVMPAGMMLSLKPTLEFVRDDAGQPKCTRI